MERPETKYAKSGDVHIAYQVFGSGPFDVVLVPDWFSNLEDDWEDPDWVHVFGRLAGFSRVIAYDQPGSGLSDPISLTDIPSLERYADDLRVVLDAAGSKTTAVLGSDASGLVALLFAATYPERTSALVLFHAFARAAWAPDHLIGLEPRTVDSALAAVEQDWGTGTFVTRLAASSDADTPADRDEAARAERRGASPGTAVAFLRMTFACDVRAVLPAIRAPTLVLHRRDNPFLAAAHGKHLADHIAGATYIELPGAGHLFMGADRADALVDEVEEFLTGQRHGSDTERALATVLFTDIVDSTAQQAALGDRRWKQVLDRHDHLLRRQLHRFGGRAIKTTGDGVLATFNGPARAIRCAIAMRDAAHQVDLDIRVGLHTGEIELRGDDIGGIAVHIGARVAAAAHSNEVLVSRTVVDLVAGSGIRFDDRGTHTLTGVPGEWQLFAVHG